MFRNELSPFLKDVLNAVAERPRGVSIGPDGAPDPRQVQAIARAVGATVDDVEQALIGLQAAYCLVESVIEFPGVLPLVWWTVHPQCAPTPEDSGQA